MEPTKLDIGFDLPNQHVFSRQPYTLSAFRYYARCLRAAWQLLLKKLGRTKKITRAQDLVIDAYKKVYGVTNEEWAKERGESEYDNLWKGEKLMVNGWFMKNVYHQLLDRALHQLGCNNILEVGSGRGINIAALAVKDANRKLTGIEISENGIKDSAALIANPPKAMIDDAGFGVAHFDRNKVSFKNTSFVKGTALAMPFADNSFDASFTVLVLEQMPYDYPKVLEEMRRVTKKYCLFIEPFGDANGLKGKLHLANVDYFRFRSASFAKYGLKPVAFYTDYPHKAKFQTGFLVTEVVK